MLQRDPLRFPLTDGPTSGRPQGLHLPFLPTLATAVLAAAVSLLCQEPGVVPVPVPVAPLAEAAIEPTSFARGFGADLVTTPIRPAAALGFAQVYPLLPEMAETRVVARSAPRFAVLPPRRPCPGPRCGAGPIPRRANPFAAATPVQNGHGEPAPVEIRQADITAEGSAFPSLALPFAPAARVVGAAAGMVRTGATALGTSVVLLVDRMR